MNEHFKKRVPESAKRLEYSKGGDIKGFSGERAGRLHGGIYNFPHRS